MSTALGLLFVIGLVSTVIEGNGDVYRSNRNADLSFPEELNDLDASDGEEFLNEWAVHIPRGHEAADLFAKEHGFINLGEVIPDSQHYHMKYPKRRLKRSLRSAKEVSEKMLKHPEVHEVHQQVSKVRVKRTNRPNDPYWDKMWYLNRGNDLDMNVEGAWQQRDSAAQRTEEVGRRARKKESGAAQQAHEIRSNVSHRALCRRRAAGLKAPTWYLQSNKS